MLCYQITRNLRRCAPYPAAEEGQIKTYAVTPYSLWGAEIKLGEQGRVGVGKESWNCAKRQRLAAANPFGRSVRRCVWKREWPRSRKDERFGGVELGGHTFLYAWYCVTSTEAACERAVARCSCSCYSRWRKWRYALFNWIISLAKISTIYKRFMYFEVLPCRLCLMLMLMRGRCPRVKRNGSQTVITLAK